MPNFLYGNTYDDATKNDYNNEKFIKATQAKEKTAEIIETLNTKKLADTHKYIQTELEALIIQAINKGEYKITLTPPSQYSKSEIITILTSQDAGYTVLNLQNGAMTISWENNNINIGED